MLNGITRNSLNSIRFKLILGLIIVVLPILGFLMASHFYSIQVVRNQVAQSNSKLIQLYMDLIDKDLERIDSYLFPFASNDTSLNRLDRPEREDQSLYQLAKYQVYSELYENSGAYGILDYFFVYSAKNHDLVLAPNSAFGTNPNSPSVTEEIIALLEDDARMRAYPYMNWTVLHVQDTPYLMRLVKRGNVYVGSLVSYHRLMMPLDLLDLGSNGKSLLVDAGYRPLYDAAVFEQEGIDLRYDPNTYRLTGMSNTYLIIGEESSKGAFSLVGVLPERNILEKLPYAQLIIYTFAGGTFLVLVAALYLLRRIILQPINRIVSAMRRVRDGHLETRIHSAKTSNEFQIMNDIFNAMVSQIQKLKIDIYEEQLLSQRAELKTLQLQINPHFYLNSLNTFYYLAEDNKTKVIKELSLSLIKYFRFMFRSNHVDFVALTEEIDHADNYLRIQQFRFPGHLSFGIAADEALREARIPPLILQTFAENAVKYAVSMDEPVRIEVTVRWDPEVSGEEIWIQIRDTGKGFPEEVLRQIEGGQNLMNDAGEHIGIWNVKRRLWLLYGGKARIKFYNDDGAVVEMKLPLRVE